MNEESCGWTGTILRVDLTHQEFFTEPTFQYAERFIGGRGIQQWIIFREVAPRIQPFDNENLIIFGTGPLTGTEAPASNFTAISSKNVLTGGANFSHVGGHFAPQLKYAGFDQVIISGRSERPVYLWTHDGRVEFKEATHLWGRTTWDTQEIIRKSHGDDDIRVACIGPAGENLVRFSAVIVDRTRAAGGGGIGAVMGSKNLKAIAVRGNRQVKISHPEKFKEAVGEALSKITTSGLPDVFGQRGTHGTVTPLMNRLGIIPVKNYQDDHWDKKKLERICFPELEKYRSREKIVACFNCPIGCGNIVYEVTDGPYAGVKVPAFEANTGYSFGSMLDIDYIPALLKAFELLSQLGLDNDGAAGVISWAVDCYERGILTKEDTDGYGLEWGDHATVVELIHKIANREGFGALLADGVKMASDNIGKGSEYYAVQVKGQSQVDGMRAAKGWALGIVTSTRGGRHLNGAPTTEFMRFPEDLGKELFGVSTAGEQREYQGKARLVVWHEQYKALVDMLGMCYYTSMWSRPDLLTPEDYGKLFSAATGMDLSSKELMLAGKRLHNIEKGINTLHAGFTRQDDLPPEILMKESIKTGDMIGERLEKEKWEQMLDEYYDLQGWDRETGWQKKETLEELGLHEIARELKKSGKLP